MAQLNAHQALSVVSSTKRRLKCRQCVLPVGQIGKLSDLSESGLAMRALSAPKERVAADASEARVSRQKVWSSSHSFVYSRNG